MSGIIDSTKKIWGDLTSGQCVKNFNNMSFGDKFTTVLKVAAIAIAAGIIAGFLGAFGGTFIGTLAGLTIMGGVGIAAFSYFTSETRLGDQLADCAQKCVETVKEAL